MRAVTWHGRADVRVDTVPDPTIQEPTDVVIEVTSSGICGSDLHYFHHGGFGAIRIKRPMILGHEVAGTVVAVADDVDRLTVGTRVAVNPSRPCRRAGARAGWRSGWRDCR